MAHSKYDNSRTVLHKDYQIVGTEEPYGPGPKSGVRSSKVVDTIMPEGTWGGSRYRNPNGEKFNVAV